MRWDTCHVYSLLYLNEWFSRQNQEDVIILIATAKSVSAVDNVFAVTTKCTYTFWEASPNFIDIYH